VSGATAAAGALPVIRAGAGAAFLLLAMLLVTQAPGTRAAEDTIDPIRRDDPEAMLRMATDRLLDISRDARSYARRDPERYYAAVEAVLDQVVDIQYFARSVMATYASSRLYRSLRSDAERQALRDRLTRFETAIKRVFMVKYADAVLAFEGERIDIASLPDGRGDPNRSTVQQIIYDRAGRSYRVQYSLHRDDDGGWLVRNVIVEDVNLGLIYRNQFAEAVEKHRGDVDYVVDHWVSLMTSRGGAENPAPEEGAK